MSYRRFLIWPMASRAVKYTIFAIQFANKIPDLCHGKQWVAKLRAHHTGESLILLDTNMEAGHGGASGRFSRLREVARQYAFMLDLAGE